MEYFDRVAVTTATTGTGTITFGSVLDTNFFSFAEQGAVDTDQVYYMLNEGGDVEIGIGTIGGSETTLSRDTVLSSRISGTAGTTKMSLAGSAQVRCISPAQAISGLDLKAPLASPALTGVPTAPSAPIGTKTTQIATTAFVDASVRRGHVYGLTTGNNGADANNDIDIAAGEAASDVAAPALMVLASTITKKLDAAWAVGTGAGGLDTGSKAVSTWYFVWLIHRSDTGVTDVLYSLSSSAPTMPENYDHKRLIWAVKTDGSGNIQPYTQIGDKCIWTTDYTEVTASTVTSATAYVIANVPPLLGTIADLNVFLYNPSAAGAGRVFSGLLSNGRYNISMPTAGGTGSGDMSIVVDGSGQIKAYNSVATNQLSIYSRGFRFQF